MARAPNYRFERLERQRAKDARSAAKAAARRAAVGEPPGDEAQGDDALPKPSPD